MKPHELVLYVAIVSFLAFQNPKDEGLPKPISKAEQARMDAANIPLRQGPSMEMLINLAESGRGDRQDYYKRLLTKAIEATGPLTHDRPALGQYLYTSGPSLAMYGGRRNDPGYYPVKHAFAVLIPAEFLPAIGKDERGSEFPRGVPIKPIRWDNP